MNTVITICAVYLALTTLINAKKKEDELQLVIEISRHGARAPGKIFPFAKNPEHNYHRPSQLTYLGKKQHYDLGMYLRKKYIEDLKFLTPNYDEREVYVQTTYLNRTYLSSLYQLMGMFPNNTPSHLDYEKYAIGKEEYLSPVQKQEAPCVDKCLQKFLIHQVNASHDYLLHLSDENCPRFSLVKEMLRNSNEYNQISEHIITQLRPRIQQLTKWDNITTAKLIINICGYIEWSSYDQLPLSFEYDQNLLNNCFTASDTKLYFKSYGHPEPWRLGGFEFLKQLQELAEIVQQLSAFNHKVYWSKYFKLHFHQNLRKDERPVFPKFIHYAAHAETLSLFYEALGLHRPDRADPAEALLIEYFKRGGKYFVRFVQKNNEERIIKLPGHSEEIQIKEFVYYIDQRLGQQMSKVSHPGYISQYCENLDFTFTKDELYNYQQALKELSDHYKLQPLISEDNLDPQLDCRNDDL